MVAAPASGETPRWYVKETGVLVPLSPSGLVGLVEVVSPETLQGQGELTVVSNSQPVKREKPVSNCLAKDRESIEDGSFLPGTGQMEEFELVCEKGTGPLNGAELPPCLYGEGFEMKGVAPSWQSTLEVDVSGATPIYYDNFAAVDVEVYCLKTKLHAEYTGSLRPEVRLGRLKFLGALSGQLEQASSGRRFYLKGINYIAPVTYKDVRAH
jgi:hypothetical protein